MALDHRGVPPGPETQPLHPTVRAVPPWDQALDGLFAAGYPQSIDAYLAGLGTNDDLGFRLAGTSADTQAATYLADQLRAIGLRNVHLEPVPVDVFEFKSASLAVSGRKIVASTFAGVGPTPPEGLSGPIVYLHDGTAADYAGLDVSGRIVLVDHALDRYWLNLIGAEATERGALGVVMTYGPDSGVFYSCAPDALGSNDSSYDVSFVPMVYISGQDGDWLKEQSTCAETVTGTVKLDVRVRMSEDGGVAYNVYGDLPGEVDDGTFVLIGSHYDGYFHSATDAASGVATGFAIAKALSLGDQPRHTIRFQFLTAEEFGTANSWYDWCVGSWWTITHAHPDWAGQIRCFVNMDYLYLATPLLMLASAECQPFLKTLADAHPDLVPNGYVFDKPMGSDDWMFNAAGVPTVNLRTLTGHDSVYHTNYMTAEKVDWPNAANVAKFVARIVGALDDGVLPLAPIARADELADAVVPGDLIAAGADRAVVERLQSGITRLRGLAAHFEAGKTGRRSLPRSAVLDVNRLVLEMQKVIGTSFTALDVWERTVYPHEQVLWDVQNLRDALAALERGRPDEALGALSKVGLTDYSGLNFSHNVYTQDLSRHAPGYYRLNWGEQGHLAPLFDVTTQYRAIQGRTWDSQTVSELNALRAQSVEELNSRLVAMTQAVEGMNSLLDEVDGLL